MKPKMNVRMVAILRAASFRNAGVKSGLKIPRTATVMNITKPRPEAQYADAPSLITPKTFRMFTITATRAATPNRETNWTVSPTSMSNIFIVLLSNGSVE
jgi:hypothetical protein